MKAQGVRILFIAEAVTLAHLARPYVLARGLQAAGYDVYLACDVRYRDVLGDNVPFLPLRSISSENFLAALAHGKRIYDLSTLRNYVEQDLRLLHQIKPALVVGDFRLSLVVSAPLTQIPYVAITNAYWSPYARPRYIVPELPLVKVIGVAATQFLFDKVRTWVFARHARPLNRLRRSYGLSTLGNDLRVTYTYADYTCYADMSQIVPTEGLPNNHHYLGPILWSPEGPWPTWWKDLSSSETVIYVTMGSSGNTNVLSLILQALASFPVTVLVASGGRVQLKGLPNNVRVADYLPGSEATARAALVVCNGGSPTSYQALAAGTPILGIPSNLDQYLNMEYVVRSGAGLCLRAGRVSLERVRTAVRALLEQPQYRERAQGLARAIATQDAATSFTTLVGQWI